jgi:hypothetical protein
MTITIEIDKEQGLSKMLSKLDELGWNYHLNDDEDYNEWSDLPEAAIEGIKEGLADIEAGRVYTFEEFRSQMDEKLKSFKRKNAD